MHPAQELLHSTVRIEAALKSGDTATGTGFYYRFLEKENGEHLPSIVTNKHVLEGADVLTLPINLGDSKNVPIGGLFELIRVPLSALTVVHHPVDEVDLCAILIGPIIASFKQRGKYTGIIAVTKTLVADQTFLEDLYPLEEVAMVGYPNGIWDSSNNSPVVRRGVLATRPSLNYDGRPEFMIDMACFPGSSGSPVFIFNFGQHTDVRGNLVMGSRIRLLGVLYAGPVHTAKGEVRISPVPTSDASFTVSRIPINLGNVIKAYELFQIENILAEMVS